MKFDVESHLGAVSRSVSSVERDGKPARVVNLSRTFGTSIRDLWKAVTDTKRIPRWFLPVSGRLVAGGHYQFEGNAGGSITACEHRSRIAVTWEFCGDTSWVDLHFTEDEPSLAVLSLAHTSVLSEHWNKFGPGATGVGWEMGMLGLAIHIEQPLEPKPDEAGFATSPDGRAFITGSSEAWLQAALDAGTDPETAHAAARRTTAFYTGETGDPD